TPAGRTWRRAARVAAVARPPDTAPTLAPLCRPSRVAGPLRRVREPLVAARRVGPVAARRRRLRVRRRRRWGVDARRRGAAGRRDPAALPRPPVAADHVVPVGVPVRSGAAARRGAGGG